jgi:hypothetical protein
VRHAYDLTRPGDVRELMDHLAPGVASARPAQVTIEFAYSSGPADNAAIETVHLDLTDLTLIALPQGADRPGVRFPQARYYGSPRTGPGDRQHPSETTFWVLGPATLTVALPDAVAPDGDAAAPLDGVNARSR